MKLDRRTYEEILAGKPNCFAIPHEFHRDLRKCESCTLRRDCLETSAQLLQAWYVGLLKGRTTVDLAYAPEDERNIVTLIMLNAQRRSIAGLCHPAALPRLFQRAMESYTKRPPEPTVEELLADIEERDAAFLTNHDEADLVDLHNGVPSDREVRLWGIACEGINQTSSHRRAGPVAHGDRAMVDAEMNATCSATHECSDSGTNVVKPFDDRQGDGADDLLDDVHDACRHAPGAMSRPPYSGDHDQIMEELRRLIGEFAASSYTGYATIRERFLALNFALNEFGRWAPRFRGFPSQIRDTDPVAEYYMVDRQIIDLNWL